MAEKIQNVPIAGGQLGWGGLYSRGDSIIPPHYSSDLLNVYEDGGTLKKRKGHIQKSDGIFVLGGAYEAASTGSATLGSYGTPLSTRISQEVYLTGTGSGADVNFTSGTGSYVVALSLEGVNADLLFSVSLYSVDGSGHPDASLAETRFYSASLTTSECWVYAYFSTAVLASNNICVVLTAIGTGTDWAKWHYSNGDGGYAPGGARVAAYYNGTTWVDVAGVDFKFKFYHKIATETVYDAHQYVAREDEPRYCGIGVSGGTLQYFTLSSLINDIRDSTAFVESYDAAVQVLGSNPSAGSVVATFPIYSYSGLATTDILVVKSRFIVATGSYLCQTAYNSCALRIKKFTTANNFYGFTNTPLGLIITSDKNAPQIWGSTTYPISGNTGDMAFTGLTNPITVANSVMYHKNRAWLGYVTINSVVYKSRIYYSGVDTPEAGYSDTGYVTVSGAVMALLDCGDYAIIATTTSTYVVLGAESISTIELIKHGTLGGVNSQSAISLYSKDDNVKVYGFGLSGIFEIDRTSKRYVHKNISSKLSALINADLYACPDYRRDGMLFGYREADVRKVLFYSVQKQSWWLEDLAFTKMLNIIHGASSEQKIYGIKNDEIHNMYYGGNDYGAPIEAYYKCGPAYANANHVFGIHKIWTKVRNEPVMSHLDVKYSRDYGSDVTERKTIRDAGFADNVPILKQSDADGSAVSTVITLYQNTISTTVNVNSASGQTVLSVASVTGYLAAQKIIINRGGARSETAVISSVGTASLTLTGNLTYTHTAAQADAVETYDESFAVSELSVDIYGGGKEDQMIDR